MTQITNVIDVPKKASDKDQLGIDSYKNGLVNFIKTAQTPLTIAMQGEWGSGKTSLMNSVKHELCEDQNPFFGVWINTWEYALLSDEQAAMTNIIQGVLNEVIEVLEANQIKDIDKLKKRANAFISQVGKVALKAGANMVTVGIAGDVTDELFNSNQNVSSIKSLHTELQKYIKICVNKLPHKKGFLFFIDDLDRINPPMAVQILELFKNIFDLEKCIFILAIDYDVVVKGLEPKFGKKTDENEREFRSFFEKIIQLPFTMPVGRYEVKDMIIDNLINLGYFSNDELNEDFKNNIQDISLLTVGKNPRAIKRLLNTLALIKCINQSVDEPTETSKIEGLVNYSVFSLQIAYPLIYKVLSEFPDFINWGQEIKTSYQLNSLSEKELEELKPNDLFDEDWEQILYQICQKDSHLKQRASRISKLLNNIKNIVIEAGEDLESMMANAFAISSVTSVNTENEQQVEDIHKSSYLKKFKANFYTDFEHQLNEINGGFKLKTNQKRVQSNLILQLLKNDSYFNNMYVSIITNKKDYRINFRSDFWYYAKADIQPLEKALNSNDEIYKGLNVKYNSALTKIEQLRKELPSHITIWEGHGINEQHYTLKFHLNIHTNKPWAIFNDKKEMDVIVKNVAAYIEAISEIK